jgi:hypothetical protein
LAYAFAGILAFWAAIEMWRIWEVSSGGHVDPIWILDAPVKWVLNWF